MRGSTHVTLLFTGWRSDRPTLRLALRQWRRPHRVLRLIRFELIAWTVRLFCWRQPMHVAIAQDGVVSTLDSDGLRSHNLAAWVAHQRLEAVVMIPAARLDVAGMADRVSRPVLPVIIRRLTGLPVGRGDCVQIALESVCLACGYERPRGITTPKELLAWTRTLPGSIGSTRSAEPTSSGSQPSSS